MPNRSIMKTFQTAYNQTSYIQNGCDKWGNLRTVPVDIIEERHRNNVIKILIYKYKNTFLYGYQIKLETLIEQKTANVNSPAYPAPEAARHSAVVEIERICTAHRSARKVFGDFTKIRYNQPELFTEDV